MQEQAGGGIERGEGKRGRSGKGTGGEESKAL